MTEEQRRICQRAVDHYGIRSQKAKLLEELGELIVEVSREECGRIDYQRVREELADVIIMCEQMRIVYGKAKVDEWIQRKLDRLSVRMRTDKSGRPLPDNSYGTRVRFGDSADEVYRRLKEGEE